VLGRAYAASTDAFVPAKGEWSMSQSSPQVSSYPSRVRKILRRLQQGYGDDATRLALQALAVFAQTRPPGNTAPPVLSEAVQSLLRRAYIQCRQQTGAEWVHHAMLYTAVRTLKPNFTYKPEYKTWPKFLLAQPTLFESQVMHEQLYVRVIPSSS
jgi:hypothetical protein